MEASCFCSDSNAFPNCQKVCGDISVPYPFGIGADCSRDDNFIVYCNETSSPPKAYLFSNESNIEIISISAPAGEVRIFKTIAIECYNSSNYTTKSGSGWIDLTKTSYRLSEKRNKYIVIGCNAIAFILGEGNVSYMSGCASMCLTEKNVEEGLCSGFGCCQTAIPQGLNYYNVSFYILSELSTVRKFSPCSYAFITEEGWYKFSKSHLRELTSSYPDGVPLVLDWSQNSSSYACLSVDSTCHNGTYGYICKCSEGYEGNPYIEDGCHDINECLTQKPCSTIDQICINLKGNHSCECPKGTELDTKRNSCLKKTFPMLPVALVLTSGRSGVSTGFFLLVILGSWLYWGLHKRKILISKQNFFEQNGGLLLKRQICSQSQPSFRIYTVEQIEKATNKFNDILGQGGQGIVYKGIFGNELVAIKKSQSVEKSQRSEFAKEMLILSQINHRHVVKLLGCCLEVDIPMLVYEFISGGTLFYRLHGPEKHYMPFVERLTVSIQSASALNYLHADASPSIVHGDVKSANILLDGKLEAKISDFGASKLAPMDKAKFATVVQGTYGYLDPESLQTYQLTEKSDLITRKTALYGDESQKQCTLALDIVASEKNGQLMRFLDEQLVNEAHALYLYDVAKLTCRCLSMKGEDRPTMREVMTELEGIRSQVLAVGLAENVNEEEPLLGQQTIAYESNTSTSTDLEKSVFSIRGR
ncbi:unnamed protein product [Spirodela intermedia]|uniref:Protein kinase domain-containing protein n=1 Tax=Spirodela intermedia TaxID=51605 RepID=A0A7I8JMI1_SPIIN|nr:unnamed protein product [Spirodela intermedia]CAA6671367.1 unnamed protein product [Spirodela intermedia]